MRGRRGLTEGMAVVAGLAAAATAFWLNGFLRHVAAVLVDLIGVSLVVPDGYLALPGFTPGPPLPDGRPTWRNPSALPRAFVVHRARAAGVALAAGALVVALGAAIWGRA